MPSARDNFLRLAEARTRKLLKDFDLLGNLSNRSNYSYSEEDVKLIFRAITKKAQETELRFKMNIQAGRDTEFKLPR
jgi:hypothetical protein